MSLSNNFPTIRPTLNLDFANSGVLDPRITFTRATTATYYDAETVALAEQNLLQQSQTFENSYWTKEFVTVTADDAVAPDGTTTADKIIEDTSNGGHRVYATVNGVLTGSVYTFSCFVKKNERQYAILTTYDTVTRYRVFDLTNGVLGGSSANITSSSITSFGNGWYRCSITWTSTAGQVFPYVGLASGDTNAAYVGNGSSMWAWGAQLELRSSATAYTPTTTQAITNYVPQLMTAAIGQPRFDYDPVTRVAKGLLIEEARTNSQSYSEEFDSTAWTKNNATVTANATVAPNGTVTADKFVENTSTANDHRMTSGTASFTVGQVYTTSIYLKAAERSFVRFFVVAVSPNPTFTVDLSNGSITWQGNQGTSVASATAVGNGWYRVSVTFTATTTSSNAFYLVIAYSSSGTISGFGDGYSGVYVWGAQFETGTFPTSYIPTTTGSVQRNADVVTMTGTNFSSWYSANAGTFYVSYLLQRSFSTATVWRAITAWSSISGNTVTSIDAVGYDGSPRLFVQNAGTTQVSQTISPESTSAVNKIVFAFKENDFAGAVNNGTVGVDTSGTVPVVNTLNIGSSAASIAQINGYIQSVRFYPLRLTNAQLQNLTKS